MQNLGETLFADFGEFRARLMSIKFQNSITPDPTGTIYLSNALSKTQYYTPEKVLPFIGIVLEEVEFLINEHDEFYNKILEMNFSSIKQNPFNEGRETYKVRIVDLTKAYSSSVKSELESYKTQLSKTAEQLRKAIESFGESSETEKLQFNISIKDVASLIRMLRDHDIIPANTSNVSLAGKISANLSGKKGGGKKIDSLEKLLSSPDEKTLDFWIEKFKELALKAKVMKENITK